MGKKRKIILFLINLKGEISKFSPLSIQKLIFSIKYVSMSKKIIVIITLFVIIVFFGGWKFYNWGKGLNENIKETIQSKKEITIEKEEKIKKPVKEKSNFDILKEEIPENYLVLGAEYQYFQNTQFLLLKKDGEIFTYDIKNKEIAKINNFVLKENEKVEIYPSISEKNKFFLHIINITEATEPGMFDFKVLGTKKFFIDTDTLTIREVKNIDLQGLDGYIYGGVLYDSKFSRFFYWLFGPPCGVLPISVIDINTGDKKEIVSVGEFGLKKTECVDVEYSNGDIIIRAGGSSNKSIVITPNEKIEKRKEL